MMKSAWACGRRPSPVTMKGVERGAEEASRLDRRRTMGRTRRRVRENGLSLVLTGGSSWALRGCLTGPGRVLHELNADRVPSSMAWRVIDASGNTWFRGISSRRPPRTGRASFSRWRLRPADRVPVPEGLVGIEEARARGGSRPGPRVRDAGPAAPWPVRRGGLVLSLYEHSLSIAFLLLFLFRSAARASAARSLQRRAQLAHGGATVGVLEYLRRPAVLVRVVPELAERVPRRSALVVLSIFLRQRGSPESKPVAAPHSQTGPG